MLFNIFLADLFLFCIDNYIANFADDNSPYPCCTDIDSVIERLQNDSMISMILLQWFENNMLKVNPEKFHLLLSDNNKDKYIQIQQYIIQNSESEKLLGIKIDSNLSFNEHVTELCTKASQKLHALERVSCFMTCHHKRTIMRAFINSQFGYCPLVWIFCSRNLNNRINRIHERALRTVYSDSISTFEELLNRDKSVTIHIRNLQALATEMFKVINGLTPEIMKKVFPIREQIRYPSQNIFETRNVRTTNYGIESLAHFGPKLWSIVPNDLKKY